MLISKSKWLALLGGALLFSGSLLAQDNKALLDALVKKGILSPDEAKQIGQEVASGSTAAFASTSGGKYLKKLKIDGRLQAQYAGISTDIDGTAADPASTNHFFLRRVYLGAKADLINNWSLNFNYDFAGSTFDKAYLEWKYSKALVLDLGFRKVNFGYEESYTSSGSLKAIERSPATRYFVESNNGRRLGAGSYRTGLFLDGEQNGFFYGVALTNPERDESAAGVVSAGGNSTNNLAYWANAGYGGKFDAGTYKLGANVGFLPDQAATPGSGRDLTVYNIFADVNVHDFELEGGLFWSDNPGGRVSGRDAKSWAYWIQPSYKFGQFEAVVRYSAVDSGGRGVNLSDTTRSAPGGGTMDKADEWYIGGNWYINGNNTKFQLGYVHAESKDQIGGAPGKATAEGIRSQMQVNF